MLLIYFKQASIYFSHVAFNFKKRKRCLNFVAANAADAQADADVQATAAAAADAACANKFNQMTMS